MSLNKCLQNDPRNLGYYRLGIAIIQEAINDVRNGNSREKVGTYIQAKLFLKSKWCKTICDALDIDYSLIDDFLRGKENGRQKSRDSGQARLF